MEHLTLFKRWIAFTTYICTLPFLSLDKVHTSKIANISLFELICCTRGSDGIYIVSAMQDAVRIYLAIYERRWASGELNISRQH